MNIEFLNKLFTFLYAVLFFVALFCLGYLIHLEYQAWQPKFKVGDCIARKHESDLKRRIVEVGDNHSYTFDQYIKHESEMHFVFVYRLYCPLALSSMRLINTLYVKVECGDLEGSGDD